MSAISHIRGLESLARGIDPHIANSILIKPNQIGSLSETLAAVENATRHG